ncbi:helix-turn-helix domain-containing protein [Planococcus sp. X10-3]|uniref:helix-turn-helix domain-containing protein n=1 Tax=Planococcus sp. X10-3 TaxID=3061240 RepID=UPI003BAE2F1F
MTFGSRLKNLRLERRLTMQEVAIKIGLAKSSYAGYEGGQRNPPIDKLVSLAQLFQVSTDFLLGLTDIPEPVNSLHKKNLYWDGIPLNEKELVLVQQVVELMVNKTQETKKIKHGRMDIN